MRYIPFEDIRAGRVPSPEDFKAVETDLRHVLSQSSFIQAACIFGSYAKGLASSSSDLDLYLCWRDSISDCEWPKAWGEIRHCQRYAADHHVPIEICPVTVERLRAGMHNISPGFAKQVKLAAERGGLIIGQLEHLDQLPMTALDEIRGYVQRKIRKIDRLMTAPDSCRTSERWHDLLGDVLSCHRHVRFRMEDAKEVGLSECLRLPEILPEVTAYCDTLERLRTKYVIELIAQRFKMAGEASWRQMTAELEEHIMALFRLLMMVERVLTSSTARV